jgi:glycosyltransferase involved in cell wall biosynthesis
MNPAKAPLLGVILKGFPRISETFISNELLLLERQGFRLHLFSMRQPRESFSHDSVKQIRAEVDYLPETLLRPLPKFLYHNVQLAAKQPRIYAAALRTAFQRFLRTRKSATIKHLFQAGYLVHHLLPRRPVTHLHAHFAHSPTSVALFASQLSGLSFSFTAHAKDIYTSHPEQLREKIQLARFVVTCTEHNRTHLNQIIDGAATSIYRVYHGIDTDLFSGEEQVKLRPVTPYRILTVARLTAKKGLPTVYRAIKILHQKGVPIRHTLIGDGEDREKIATLIADLGLSTVSQCLGTQTHQVVLDHYRNADVFVLGCEVASNGDRDGIPNVCLESMAMGVPVVATSISAIPELVESEKSGLLVSPGRPDELAGAMLRLLTDHDLRARVIPAARQRVRQFFDNRKLIAELAEIYRREGIGVDACDLH